MKEDLLRAAKRKAEKNAEEEMRNAAADAPCAESAAANDVLAAKMAAAKEKALVDHTEISTGLKLFILVYHVLSSNS